MKTPSVLNQLEMIFRHDFREPFGLGMEAMAILCSQFVDFGLIGGLDPPREPSNLLKKLLEACWRDNLKQNGGFVGWIPHGMWNPSWFEEEQTGLDG
jgi:hypothetical protein